VTGDVVRLVLRAAGLTTLTMQPAVLRKDRGADILGLIVLAAAPLVGALAIRRARRWLAALPAGLLAALLGQRVEVLKADVELAPNVLDETKKLASRALDPSHSWRR
jgi:hypothetical protein